MGERTIPLVDIFDPKQRFVEIGNQASKNEISTEALAIRMLGTQRYVKEIKDVFEWVRLNLS